MLKLRKINQTKQIETNSGNLCRFARRRTWNQALPLKLETSPMGPVTIIHRIAFLSATKIIKIDYLEPISIKSLIFQS